MDRKHGRILVGFDGSKSSVAALSYAAEEAVLRGSELLIVTVWELSGYEFVASPEFVDTLRESGNKALAQANHFLDTEYPNLRYSTELVQGDPAYELAHRSSQVDLIVVGARGHGGFASLLLGSVSDQLVHHASVPVTVVRS